MKKKILGMFMCMLLMVTAVPAVESLANNAIISTVPNLPLTSMTGRIEKQKHLHSNGPDPDVYGCSVSLDGDTALKGAPYDDDNGDLSGSVYVYTRTGTTWTQQAKLLPSDGAANGLFGDSVSLSGDTALILGYGSVYVFTRTGAIWTQQQKLITSDGGVFDGSISLDGDTALVQGYQCVYVFTRTGTTWAQQAKLTASEIGYSDWFGYSVSLDGDTALVGSWFVFGMGYVYVFTRNGTIWTQQAKFTGSYVDVDAFGSSVSLSGDTALIGAEWDNEKAEDAGAAYVYTRTGTTWTEQAILTALDNRPWGYFGRLVSLDGDTALIGDSYGHAYVFTRNGTTWIQQAKLTTSDIGSSNSFGWSISLDGDTALIGTVWSKHIIGGHGFAYVFTRTGTTWKQQGKFTLYRANNVSNRVQREAMLPVSINTPVYQLIEKLFQRFPNAFPILRQLLGY
ncbi:MAG: FG-GAP repeat protein [Euryarchaeota archaeon]|nr:FG-GAP repeat protein [Euryarchaeota archaeon]